MRPGSVEGSHQVPGDKSITHRALLLAALAPGRSVVRGGLASDDARSTARVLRALGAEISPLRSGGTTLITGRRRFQPPAGRINCGNSGTTARLLLGLLAAHRFATTVTGDRSLRGRPMRRVTDPLRAMGARVDASENDGLPLTMTGGKLHPFEWTLPVASAQIKSALLLAGVAGAVPVTLHEPAASRDHTERMLRHFGYEVDVREGRVSLRPTGKLVPFEIDIPGDPSSAIFLLAAALLAPAGTIEVTDVGINPSRIGYLATLARMGAAIAVTPGAERFNEPRGTLSASASTLVGVHVPASEVPGIIDEIPMLAALAARALGASQFDGLAELRVKESDRLALLARNLAAIGVDAGVDGDNLHVQGSDAPLRGQVVTHGDHRIAMAFSVLAAMPGARIVIDDVACASVSFPGFADKLAALHRGRR